MVFGALRLDKAVFVVAAGLPAHAQSHYVVGPERPAAPNAPLPADPPDHARRVVVMVEHGFAAGALVEVPWQRIGEPRG